MERLGADEKARLVLDITTKVCPDVIRELRDILNIQQTCRGWREVLLLSDIHSARITVRNVKDAASMRWFAPWLAQHAGLVQSLRLDSDLWRSSSSSNIGSTCFGPEEAQQTPDVESEELCLRGIQAAAAAGLKLRHFSSNCLCSIPLLQVLPSTLQQLDLSSVLGSPCSNPIQNDEAFITAMARFTALQEMTVGKAVGSDEGVMTPTLLSTLNTLPNLSRLVLEGAKLDLAATQQLPQQLTALTLGSCSIPLGMNLSHMTALQELDLAPSAPASLGLELTAGVAATAQLPTSLTGLTLLMAKQRHSRLDLTPLQHLQRIALLDSREEPTWLQQLASLPALNHMHLRYMFWKPLIITASSWSSLPQLQQLDLHSVDIRQHWQLELLLASIAAATTLTSLSVSNLVTRQPVKLCSAVQALPNLVSLAVEKVQLAKCDPLALTSVTQLSSLALVNCSSAVDDVIAVAVCWHLSGLQHLNIVGRGLAGMGLLYPISAQLKDLRSLNISGRASCACDEFSLSLLSSLTKLTHLGIPGNPGSLAMSVQGLRRAAPGLGSAGVTIHTTCSSGYGWAVA